MWKQWMAGALLAGSTALAAAQAHHAGIGSLDVPYHGSRIETTMWYPSRDAETARSFGPYRVSVALGGAPVEGRHPLVLVSHGTGGNALNQHLQAEALARRGFIVASLTHPGDNFQDRSMVADQRYFYERPRQISRVLDALLAHPEWKHRIDVQRIGAMGHSAGGYTVAALIGGAPDPTRMTQHCARTEDDPVCRFRDPRFAVAAPSDEPLQLPASVGAPGEVQDSRIRAVVMLAPLGQPIEPGTLGRSTAAVKLIGAEHEEVLHHRYHYEHLRSELPRAQARLARGAGHYSFIAPIDAAWKQRLGPVASDPSGFDREAFHRELSDEIVTFFEHALRQ